MTFVNQTDLNRGVTSSLSVLVTDEERTLFSWILYVGILSIVCSFGIMANILNIICFARQGLKDSVNISLIGLAVSDLGCLVTAAGAGIGFNPAVIENAVIPYDPMEVIYLVSGMPHVAFAGISAWITALITLERCLCITMPLKVKNIVTPRRVTIILICLFIVLLGRIAPLYFVAKVGMEFSPERNETILALVSTSKNRAIVDMISFAVNQVAIPVLAFLMIIVCTIILVIELQQKTKWRLKTAGVANVERDQKVARMVVMISALFIACFIPMCFTFVAMIVVPGLAVDGLYKNTVYILVGVSGALEATNSASNIFIYYHMSSKYKKMFRTILCGSKST